MNPRTFAFTKSSVEKIPPAPDGKRIDYRDTKEPTLALRVSSTGNKSFVVLRRQGRSVKRIALGKFPTMTVQQARSACVDINAQLNRGVDPIAEKRAADQSGVTLQAVFDAYVSEAEKRGLKESTIHDYRSSLNKTFDDWRSKPLADISREMVRQRHEERGQKSESRANSAMRLLRALWTFAHEFYGDGGPDSPFALNPVTTLNRTKSWYRQERRKRYITPVQMPLWWDAVQNLPNGRWRQDNAETVRDYLIFLLFTGTRRTEAACLTWDDLDSARRTFTLQDPKNRTPVTLPIPLKVIPMLERRRSASIQGARWVFPNGSRTDRIVDFRKTLSSVQGACGFEFTPHDLRRTYMTIGESLDISVFTLKRLMNHKSGERDVTGGYLGHDLERLRRAAERISEELFRLAGCE